MDFLQALENAESDLADTLDSLQEAKELVAMLEQDAKRMKLELVGMQSFASRQGLTSGSNSEGPDAEVVPISADVKMTASEGPDLSLMSRSEAVATVMRSLGGPVDRSTIHEHFVDADRFDSIDDISLTLSGLKRSGRAQKLGHGLWQFVEDTAAVL